MREIFKMDQKLNEPKFHHSQKVRFYGRSGIITRLRFESPSHIVYEVSFAGTDGPVSTWLYDYELEEEEPADRIGFKKK